MLTQTCPKQHCFIVEIEGYAQDECPKCRERLTTTKTTRLDFENYIISSVESLQDKLTKI